MKRLLTDALLGLRARRGRTALAAGVVFAASLVLGVVISSAYGLRTGFDRAADRADLPSVIARFDDQDRASVDARVRALPNLAARAYRTEITGVRLAERVHMLEKGVIHIVDGGRRGYAIVAGRDVAERDDEVVVEAGLARAWNLHPGDRLVVGRLGPLRVVGVALSPDNVAFPLARTARVYLSRKALERRFGGTLPVNVALLWARDESRTDVLLSQARASAGGVRGLRFTTRDGVRALVEQAAGLVVALLLAFAVVAAGLSGVLLAAGARSDVQRRMPSIGVRRSLGATPAGVGALHATEGALVAALPAALGLTLGGLLAARPVSGVLDALNELAPGTQARLTLLAGVWLIAVGLVAGAAAAPAWRAARGSPGMLLRRGDVTAPPRSGAGGLAHLGVRLVTARRARFGVLIGVLGTAVSVVLLLLGLASLLTALRDDPATLGKRYQLTARLPVDSVARIEAIPGVLAAAPRYELNAISATALGSPLRLIAYPGDHTRFEAPPLSAGRRARSDDEAEVGAGLADAVGLRVGSTLAVQPQLSSELRFRVVGIVRALLNEGRVAYVQPGAVTAAGLALKGRLAVRLEPGADTDQVRRELALLGAEPSPVGGATGSNRALLDLLARLLRLVAVTVGLVCLGALAQTLALTTAERRSAVATLRSAGADERALRRLLVGSALAVSLPAALLALGLELFVLTPLTERLTVGYADLPLRTNPAQVTVVAVSLAVLAAIASVWTARRLAREPVIAGLREVES